MKQNIFGLVLVTILATSATRAEQSASAPPQAPDATAQPGVTFRAEVNYVEVDARVVDAEGNFVSGLTQTDFQILEDGKPQQVTVFSLINLPVERTVRPLFANRPIEPDVQTNQSGYNGRVYLIVLDDMHTAALRSSRVKAAAKQFVQRYLGANDVAAIVHTSGRADAAQEFTSNPRLLVNAIDKFMGRKLRSSLLNRIEEESRTRGTRDANDRINDPDAHWKFEEGDLRERELFDDYHDAYQQALRETSRPWAPWYAIPADDKYFMRRTVAEILVETLRGMDLHYPATTREQELSMASAKRALERETRQRKK